MKKNTIFLLFILISIGSLSYSLNNLITAEARTPSWFWSLSPTTRLIARTVNAESKGEPYLGQVAVAAVIMNRVRDPRFPNTISGVIYQPWAFTPVAYGLIWNQQPTNSSIKATLAAMRGWDPTYGCVYFYNPAKVTSNWIFSRRVVRKIGRHIFAK